VASGPIAQAAAALIDALAGKGLRLACAESCTGGMVSSAITDVPGASAVLWGGVTAYSNECKIRMLGVPPDTIAEFGAVSREVARAMALGALERSRPSTEGDEGKGADVALAITGIAGPDGGSAQKPVGLVWFAFRLGETAFEESVRFTGDRGSVRAAAAAWAMTKAAALVMGRY
jgi:nicotinamide-nucleotide amidase